MVSTITLDRNVPIMVLIVVVLNIAGGIWWASKLDEQVVLMKTQVIELQKQISILNSQDGRIIRLETQMGIILQKLESIDTKVDRISTLRGP